MTKELKKMVGELVEVYDIDVAELTPEEIEKIDIIVAYAKENY